MRLEPGQKIPDFELPDLDGNTISKESLAGKKTLITFYRYAECIFCNLRIHHLVDRLPDYEAKGLQVLGFFHSPKEDLLKYMGKGKSPFPVLADPGKKYYQKFGIGKSTWGFIKGLFRLRKFIATRRLGLKIIFGAGGKVTMPADFLVDENGVIIKAFYGTDMTEHLPFEEIDAFLN